MEKKNVMFIANCLEFNGGTTFLLRFAKAMHSKGVRPGVLVLFESDIYEPLKKELSIYADLFYLKDYLKVKVNKYFSISKVNVFFPCKLNKLSCLFEKYENNLHIMGLFGLLWIDRFLRNSKCRLKISTGIYHQNEFMFENVDYSFAKYSQELFLKVFGSSLIFFNESSLFNYSKFFGKDYSGSPVIPIGIERKKYSLGSFESKKIVSIGNLVNFKTYNKHIIQLMPQFLKKCPNLSYHIYGKGPEEKKLKDLVKFFSVEDNVKFYGYVDYNDIEKVLADCFLFVGSGTAILEACELGIPSIIGIESIQKPLTYGYLYNTETLSYNEYDPVKKTFEIKQIVDDLIQKGYQFWEIQADACKKKSGEFYIDNYLGVFLQSGVTVSGKDLKKVKPNLIKNLISLIHCGLDTVFFRKKNFSERRVQGAGFK